VQATIREHVQAVFDSSSAETHESEVTLDELASLAGGELGHFLDARRAVVASLVHDITAAVKSESPETRVVYLDPSGATLGYTTGRPTTERTAVEIAWQDGIDLRSIGQTVDGMGVLAYFADPGRWLRELEAYSTLLNSADLEVVLRPMPPDTSSPEELREKLVNLRRLRRCDASFYHYGLMRLENLDWVHQALIAA
jgi:hypothetical protein